MANDTRTDEGSRNRPEVPRNAKRNDAIPPPRGPAAPPIRARQELFAEVLLDGRARGAGAGLGTLEGLARGGGVEPLAPVDYDRTAALLLSAVSAWAYSDVETLWAMAQTCGLRAAGVAPLAFSVKNGALFVDAQGFLLEGDVPAPQERSTGARQRRIAIVAFRGTEVGGVDVTDVFTDANVEKVQFPDGKGSHVHGGFHRCFKYLWPRMESAVADALKRADALYVTGHSLGAALAVLATAQLWSDEPAAMQAKCRGLYTFGQPMVGDAKFAQHCAPFEDLTFRHVYQYDVVPRLPPRTTGPFRHFGIELRGTRTTPWQPHGAGAPQALAGSLSIGIAALALLLRQFPATRRIPLPFSFDDHIPQRYVDCAKLASVETQYP